MHWQWRYHSLARGHAMKREFMCESLFFVVLGIIKKMMVSAFIGTGDNTALHRTIQSK